MGSRVNSIIDGDNMAKEFAKSFYNSKIWKECRESYISKVFGQCEICGEPGYILHHKIELTPENINDPTITLNHSNLQYLCLDCHNKIHGIDTEVTREGVCFNEYGEVVVCPHSQKTYKR